jgi:hypothetical protein
MKGLGYGIITLGFVAGAYLLVLDERQVAWGAFLPTVLVAAVGVVMVRTATRREAQHEGRRSENIDSVRSSLRRLCELTDGLDEEKGSVDVYELRHRIDAQFRSDLETFAAAREVISHLFGLQAYADVMSRFAAGERYLNRVWSASTDGYIDEAHDYLTKAREQLADARRFLEALVEGEKG